MFRGGEVVGCVSTQGPLNPVEAFEDVLGGVAKGDRAAVGAGHGEFGFGEFV